MVTTQSELTRDAIRRDYKPGAVVILIDGSEVQLTSWPWFDGAGDNRQARVMARRVVGDCTTNTEVPYFMVMRLVRHVDL